jgi:positive phototaxis protein PixI
MSDFTSIPDAQSSPAQNTAIVPISETSEQFLRLSLANMEVLLPVRQLTEVLNISLGQIVPIPHMPAWVMGVYNWRGDILWMMDLGHRCGLTPWYQQPTYGSSHAAVVLQVRQYESRSPATPPTAKTKTIGLVVRHVGELEQCYPGAIQALPPSSIPPELAPLLRGYWWQPEGEMLAVLDGEALIRALPN